MRVTRSDLVAEQRFDLRKLACLIAGFTLAASACTLLFLLGAETLSAWGLILFVPALWKYRSIHIAQKNGLRAFIERNFAKNGVIKYKGKGENKEPSELMCPCCFSKNFVRKAIPGNALIAEMHCEDCSVFLYNTTT